MAMDKKARGQARAPDKGRPAPAYRFQIGPVRAKPGERLKPRPPTGNAKMMPVAVRPQPRA